MYFLAYKVSFTAYVDGFVKETPPSECYATFIYLIADSIPFKDLSTHYTTVPFLLCDYGVTRGSSDWVHTSEINQSCSDINLNQLSENYINDNATSLIVHEISRRFTNSLGIWLKGTHSANLWQL